MCRNDVLLDEKTIGELEINENDFISLMIIKP